MHGGDGSACIAALKLAIASAPIQLAPVEPLIVKGYNDTPAPPVECADCATRRLYNDRRNTAARAKRARKRAEQKARYQ